MSNKTIWLIDQYASTPSTGVGGGGRHYYLAKELVAKGYQVFVMAAGYTHLLSQPKKVEGDYAIENEGGVNFVWFNMPEYSDAHDKKRIMNWFLFVYKLIRFSSHFNRPDVVLASSPSPFIFLAAKRIAKKYRAKLVFEVRDIWPLTLIELGGVSPKHPFILLMKWVEKKAYVDSDIILSNLPFAIDHIKKFGIDENKFHWLPNGFSKSEMDNSLELSPKEQSELPKKSFVVGYTGTFGVANALNYLLDAAVLLKNYEDISFVLVGKGKEKQQLVEKVVENDLINVYFVEPIQKVKMQSMLKTFDVCFIGWNDDRMYRFGISPNKIPEYLYAAKPIIHSFSGKGDMVEMSGAGISVPAENPEAIADAVLRLKKLSDDERARLGALGRDYAVKNVDYTSLANKFTKMLLVE